MARQLSGTAAFVTLSVGQVISAFGTSLAGFAFSVWVFEKTRSVTQYALLITLMTLPGAVVRPLVGALVDRWDRRWILIGSDVGAASMSLLTLLLVLTNELTVPYLYLTTLVMAVVSSFQLTAGMAALQQLVTPAEYGRASAASGAAKSLGMLAAPLATGTLLTHIGMAGILYLDLATFGVGLATLLVVRIPPLRDLPLARPLSLLGEVRQGTSFLLQHRGLLLVAAVSVLVTCVFEVERALVTPLVLSFDSADVLGAIMSSAGVGVLVGNLLMLVVLPRARSMHVILTAATLIGGALVASGLRQSPTLIGAGAFVAMVGVTAIWIALDTIWLNKVPANLLGRVKGTVSTFDSVLGTTLLLSVGALSDRLFEPLMAVGGAPWLDGAAQLIGRGPGRGVALMLVLTGALVLLLAGCGWMLGTVRSLEDGLPSAESPEPADGRLAAGAPGLPTRVSES